MAKARSSGMNWAGAAQGLGQGMMSAGAQMRKPGQPNSPTSAVSSAHPMMMGDGLMSFIDPTMLGSGGAQQLLQYLMSQWQDDDQLAE